jgi:hypothetical protein
VTEANQFALHAPVSPTWVLCCQADDELVDCRCGRGTSGSATCGVVAFARDRPAVPGQDRGGGDGKTWAQR